MGSRFSRSSESDCGLCRNAMAPSGDRQRYSPGEWDSCCCIPSDLSAKGAVRNGITKSVSLILWVVGGRCVHIAEHLCHQTFCQQFLRRRRRVSLMLNPPLNTTTAPPVALRILSCPGHPRQTVPIPYNLPRSKLNAPPRCKQARPYHPECSPNSTGGNYHWMETINFMSS